MSLHEFNAIEQGSEAWHDQRRGMVTASVVSKLVTPTLKVAENETSRGLVATLVAERITGYTEPSFMNDDMMRGVLHEPIARDKYAEHNSVTVDETGFLVRIDLAGHELGASPDGLVGDDGGIEVKCPRAKTHISTIVADKVPGQYMAQIQTCLLVSGRDWWDFVSFCAGLPLFIKRVHPDPAWAEAIVSALLAFEESAADLAANYRAAAAGLPATELINDDDIGLVF